MLVRTLKITSFAFVQVCVKTLLDLAHRSGQHVLLVGSSGAGKTTVINNFLASRGLYLEFGLYICNCGT